MLLDIYGDLFNSIDLGFQVIVMLSIKSDFSIDNAIILSPTRQTLHRCLFRTFLLLLIGIFSVYK